MEDTTKATMEVAKVGEETVNVTPEEAKAAKKRATPAEQDQLIADEIAEAGTLIATVTAEPEILAALAVYGTDTQELAVGEGLQATAQDRFTDRQAALANDNAKSALAIQETATVRTAYADFREVCRARITDPNLRQALSLNGSIPQDRQKMMTQARAAYGEAAKPVHQPALAKIGFGPSVLAARLAGVDGLDTALAAARDAAGAARGATVARNQAAKELRQWVTSLRRIARRALRTRPELAAKLRL